MIVHTGSPKDTARKLIELINKCGKFAGLYETAKETLMYRSVLGILWERERVGRFGRMALIHV